jgi:hypothetical protein
MMAEHTPGPWFITGPNIRSDNHKDGVKGALLFLQQAPFSGYEPDTHEFREEMAANLQLAAAAPKLKAIVLGFLGTLDTSDLETEAVARSFYNTNAELFTLAQDTIETLNEEV